MHTEVIEMTFRKETFDVIAQYYICEDTGERFTTDKQDNLAINQLYNQYRERHGIPFVDDINDIISRYDVSAAKMSKILGFGENQYAKYMKGEIPSVSNGKLISLISDVSEFKKMVDKSQNEFTAEELKRIEKKLIPLQNNDESLYKTLLSDWLFSKNEKSIYTGYIKPDLDKVKNCILYFLHKFDGVFETKLNKLLFYSDFLSFKNYGVGISGLSYRAIDFGPVPQQYSTIYENIGNIDAEIVPFPHGTGKRLTPVENIDMSIFKEREIEIFEQVFAHFKNYNAVEISEASHKEAAWIESHDKKSLIRYDYGFCLKAM